jgi:hypothetical protein
VRNGDGGDRQARHASIRLPLMTKPFMAPSRIRKMRTGSAGASPHLVFDRPVKPGPRPPFVITERFATRFECLIPRTGQQLEIRDGNGADTHDERYQENYITG